MRFMVAAALLLCAAAARAETPVTAEEFRAWVEGYTVYFEEDGEPFGAETFLPGGEVIWKPEGGACERGVWGGDDEGLICFLYPRDMACWRISRDGGEGFVARLEGDQPFELRIARRDRRPLLCGDEPAV